MTLNASDQKYLEVTQDQYYDNGIIAVVTDQTGFEFAGGALFHLGDAPEVAVIFHDSEGGCFYYVANNRHLPDAKVIILQKVDPKDNPELKWLYRPSVSIRSIVFNQVKALSTQFLKMITL